MAIRRTTPSSSSVATAYRSNTATCSRNHILFVMMGVLLVAFYFNFTYHASSFESSPGQFQPQHLKGKTSDIVTLKDKPKNRFPAQDTMTNPEIPKIKVPVEEITNDPAEDPMIERMISTSTSCSDRVVLQAEVLKYSIQKTDFLGKMVQVVAQCSEQIQKKDKGDKNVVKLFSTQTFNASENALEPSINPHLLQEYLNSPDGQRLKDDGYVLLMESNSILLKEPMIALLRKQTNDVKQPQGFGQDAQWYFPREPILPRSTLERVCGKTSNVLQVGDWRDYAVDPPFVLQKQMLKQLLPQYLAFWDKLETKDKHLAFPLALAHHELAPGITGSLRVHEYGARYENWDFTDDMSVNPCNSTIQDAIEMPYFPFTLQVPNATLTRWPDGRDWEFGDAVVPHDFLKCDGWLLQLPSEQFWELATHTRGNELVTTILRRRHVFTLCTAIRTYNSAALRYKQRQCAAGFNTNKRLRIYTTKHDTRQVPQEHQRRTSALPFGENANDVEFRAYGNYPFTETVQQKTQTSTSTETIHFVFATSCSGRDNSQAENLMNSALNVEQHGRFTRILSGCTTDEINDIIERSSSYPHLQYHAVPEYRRNPVTDVTDDYEDYIKPFGLRHWIRNANPAIAEAVIVVLSVDFYFLRRFDVNTGNKMFAGRDAKTNFTDNVDKGIGFGQNWNSYVNFLKIAPKIPDICGKESNCKTFTAESIVGPPYVLARSDLVALLDDYCNVTVSLRQNFNMGDMSEVLGFAIAAAKNQIQFTRFSNIAVTNVDDPHQEAWDFVKEVSGNPCEASLELTIPPSSPFFLNAFPGYEYEMSKTKQKWIYKKELLPEDLYACDSWMLQQSPTELWKDAKAQDSMKALINAFSICSLVKFTNRALYDYKKKTCTYGFNEHKALRLKDPRPAPYLQVGKAEKHWIEQETSKVEEA